MSVEKKKHISRRVGWLAAIVLLLLIVEVLFDPFSMAVNSIVRLIIRFGFRQARSTWEAAGIENYDLLLSGFTSFSCLYLEEPISVRDGQAPERPDTPTWQYCLVQLTVPAGLDEVEEALGWGGSIQAIFDQKYGYVSSFHYSCMSGHGLFSPIISDCGGGFHIIRFTPLENP